MSEINANVTANEQEKETVEKTAEEINREKKANNSKKHVNAVYLRGRILAIKQELTNNGPQNVITVSTPSYDTNTSTSIVPVDVIIGSNERINALGINNFNTGDHVVINAECKTYFNPAISYSRTFLYLVKIEKDIPASGFADIAQYLPPSNEAYFVGKLQNIYQPSNNTSNNFRLLMMNVNTTREEGENQVVVKSHPTVAVGGRPGAVFMANMKKFVRGSRMGVLCNIRMRKKGDETVITWVARGFQYSSQEDGELVDLPVPEYFSLETETTSNPRQNRRVRTVRPNMDDVAKADTRSNQPPQETGEVKNAPADASEQKHNFLKAPKMQEIEHYAPAKTSSEESAPKESIDSEALRRQARMQALQDMEEE